MILALAACAATPVAPAPTSSEPTAEEVAETGGQETGQAEETGSPLPLAEFVFRGATVLPEGNIADVAVSGTSIVEVGTDLNGAVFVDLEGKFLVPAFVDSHVHLALKPKAEEMADGGLAAAVDMASPLSFFEEERPLRLRVSGPMITATGGYPTQGWGSDGYGLECDGPEAAAAAVDALQLAGADLIKIPITSQPALDDASVTAATVRAHQLGLRVASHALTDAEAARAASADVDVLAHTPTAALTAPTLALWESRAVISTLRAFGGSSVAVANLAALNVQGTTILYGTDFGNTQTTGIDGDEIALLVAAGLDGRAILEAGTRAPALFWGFEDLGEISAGKRASFLVLSVDPRETPGGLATPEAVWIDGVKRP